MSSQPYVKGNLFAAHQVTNKLPSSPARLGKRARHQLSFPYSSTALPPPSFPAHPGSSTSVYSRLEGLLTAENYTYRSTRLVPTGKKLKKKTNHWQYRRTPLRTSRDDS